MGWFDRKKKVTYKLVKDGRAVGIGTTNNPARRNFEHSESEKRYDYLQVTSPRVPKSEADWRETRNLRSFKETTGRLPRYNKTSDGKFHFGRSGARRYKKRYYY